MRRITKREAKKLFSAGKIVMFCPCKMRPSGPFSMAASIHPVEWLEKAELYNYDGSTLWKGNVQETAWSLAYNSWSYYNASYETGYYPHYYVD